MIINQSDNEVSKIDKIGEHQCKCNILITSVQQLIVATVSPKSAKVGKKMLL